MACELRTNARARGSRGSLIGSIELLPGHRCRRADELAPSSMSVVKTTTVTVTRRRGIASRNNTLWPPVRTTNYYYIIVNKPTPNRIRRHVFSHTHTCRSVSSIIVIVMNRFRTCVYYDNINNIVYNIMYIIQLGISHLTTNHRGGIFRF